MTVFDEPSLEADHLVEWPLSSMKIKRSILARGLHISALVLAGMGDFLRLAASVE